MQGNNNSHVLCNLIEVVQIDNVDNGTPRKTLIAIWT